MFRVKKTILKNSERALKPLIALFIFSCLVFSVNSHGATELFEYVDGDPQFSDGSRFNIQMFTTSATDLKAVDEIEVTLPSGANAVSSVVTVQAIGPLALLDGITDADETIAISLAGNSGAINVYTQQGLIIGLSVYEGSKDTYHVAVIDASGQGSLLIEPISSFRCEDFPVAETQGEGVLASDIELANVPDEQGLEELQSRPGSSRVIYIDYLGGVVSNTFWNSEFTSGAPIFYDPFDNDNDSSNFSEEELYVMYVAWLEMAEDFAPFDVNITTDKTVFDATPDNFRSTMIGTSTQSWLADVIGFQVGGVALLNGFGASGANIGWSFNNTAGSMGQTHSHEAGHQLGLNHDGTLDPGGLEYYGGHGRWGPIMGGPFNQEYVQWSKGDYPGANNSEDDLAIINSRLVIIPDEAGNDSATATALALPVFEQAGVIVPDGLSADPDVYSFTLAAEDPDASVEVKTRAGFEDESFAANLAFNATLENENGSFTESVASNDVDPLSPFTNVFSYNGPLSAGTYTLTIDAVSPDDNWATGFDEYGNGGSYIFSVDADSGECDVTDANLQYSLPQNEWHQIGLPCQPPAGSTVATVFGDDISAVYDSVPRWVLYSYDPAANSYDKLAVTDELQMGVGYWMIQNIEASVTLDLPAGSVPAVPDPTIGMACESFTGCVGLPLSGLAPPMEDPPSDNPKPVWNMLSNPTSFAPGIPFTDLSIKTSSGDCLGGCSMDEANDLNIAFNRFYHWNGVNYDDSIGPGPDIIGLWAGFWAAEFAASEGIDPVIVVPLSTVEAFAKQ